MKKKASNAEDWDLGTALGLRLNGGWTNAFHNILLGCTTEQRPLWEKLLKVAAEAQPRTGGDWVETERKSGLRCGSGPQYLDELPHPEPGTPAYQETLLESSPSEEWFADVRRSAEAIGGSTFTNALAGIYRGAMQGKPGTLNPKAPNREVLRAIIWFAHAVPAAPMIQALGQFAAWSVEKKTAQAATIGIVLASILSEEAAGALRMIEVSAKRPSPKERFARYASHVEGMIGITAEESAERFVPSFGLDAQGTLSKHLGEHGLMELTVEGSKAVLHFKDAEGKETPKAATAIKRACASELKQLKAAAKGLDLLLGSQKRRLEGLLAETRSWPFSIWRERYLEHPVVAVLARRLIWTFDGVPAVIDGNVPVDATGTQLLPHDNTEVRLWHPLGRSVDEVTAWRARLEELNIRQPFKQAHREIYVLTDAERTTGTYSNRFAGHILKQSQFRALAPGRGWEAPFLGSWDGGEDGPANRKLPEGWRVEFWADAAGEQFGASGGFLHISTDQVRFYPVAETEPASLNQVPALIFSEAMRDIDLFVGVSTVANDPTWADGGPDGRHRDYWQAVAFGELAESAAMRREVLQRLVSRLKIADVCSFTERFLVVRGTKRTYRIHLGSGNILMEPNNQYLCIVADRRAGLEPSNFFLPFEGDQLLSLIISKAFLLAADDQITDPTIIRQIESK